MAQTQQTQAGFFQDGVDRIRETFGSIESEVSRVQKDLQKDLRSRRRSIEKQIAASRKDFEKRSKRLRKDLSKNPAVKQVEQLRKRASDQIEQSVDGVLSLLQIASKSDLQRLDRKLSEINRRLKDLDAKKRARRS